MWLPISQLVCGLCLLLWAADRLMAGAVALAHRCHWSPLVIGMTVVGIGTSLPEVVMVLMASLKGYRDAAVGSLLGSNIINILLILGIAGILQPLAVPARLRQWDLIWLLGVTLLLGWPLAHYRLERFDGWALSGIGLLFIVWSVWRHAKQRSVSKPFSTAAATTSSTTPKALLNATLGLGLLPLGAHWVVEPATQIAQVWGISELVIGITLMSLGSSLPEVATVVVGVYQRQPAVVLGNIIGSNLFNSLVVMVLPAWIAPGALDPHAFIRDYWVMLGATLLLVLFCWQQPSQQRMTAVLMLGSFAGYLWWLAY